MRSAQQHEVDKRAYPRVTIERPAVLVAESGKVARASVADIGPLGLRLCCDRNTATTLHPRGRHLGGKNTPHVEVHLTLPLASGPSRLVVVCRLVHLTAEPAGRVYLGAKFEAFKQRTQATLYRFIGEALDAAQT